MMSQSEHEAWNARNYPGTRQLCTKCDQPTGRCEEDSIFDGLGNVLCEDCGAWTLDTALEYIRELQPVVMESGWCLMLGGGVLNRGAGPDLDILAYPRTRESDLWDLFQCFPLGGQWSDVGVADVYSFKHDSKLIELIIPYYSSFSNETASS